MTAPNPAGSPTHITQEEAAAVCGKSFDTIRRYRRHGKLPNSRTRPDGMVEVAVADLVAAGLLSPLAAASGEVPAIAGRSRAERDLAAARQELAVANVRMDELAERLARSESEVEFLRAVLKKAGVA